MLAVCCHGSFIGMKQRAVTHEAFVENLGMQGAARYVNRIVFITYFHSISQKNWPIPFLFKASDSMRCQGRIEVHAYS